MHIEIGHATCELRRRLEWSQEQLAEALTKYGEATHPVTVSRWERGVDSPSPEKRSVLGRIADRRDHADLAEVFRAPMSAWRLASYVCRRRARHQG